MSKFAVLRNLIMIIIIVGVVFMFSNYAEPVKNMVFGMLNIPNSSVLGASSQRAEEFSQKVGSDIGGHLENLQKQALNIKMGDIVNTLSRAQKIPQDLNTAREFIKEQADNVLQSTK